MATDSTSTSRAPARPSSSTSDGLFDGIYARGDVAAAVGGDAWLQAMLDVEAALARACAAEGLIPRAAAEAIGAACRIDAVDGEAIARATADHASPVVPLVRALRDAVGGDAADHVHHGATSQDIVDTAASLVARRALDPLLRDARSAMDAAARLADDHRATPVMGRTLLQQAVPTSFGLKAAVWLNAIADATAWVADTGTRALAVQMGGPVGSRSPAVAAHVARALELADPVIPWHTNRARPAGLASSLGALAGALAKVAGDVILLSQTEVGEVREGGGPDRGGSSAMPHKRNPVASVSIVACTQRVPALVAAVFSALPQEHERAAGRWQSEWGTISELLALTGSTAAWGAELLGGLQVDAERMRANLGDAEPDLGAAGELIDRALSAYRASP